jgi:two-component SAPR family response regulator
LLSEVGAALQAQFWFVFPLQGLTQSIYPEVYNHGVEIDPLIEEFHQELMKCYIEQGHLANARAIYESCHRALKEGLGVSPSPKTESLRKEIS